MHFAEGRVVKLPLEHAFACDVMKAETAVDRGKE
jgi:hypothetical protein